MSNPGNTGKRYKIATVVKAEGSDGNVIETLSCGHTRRYGGDLASAQKHIGTRTGCYECKAVVQ